MANSNFNVTELTDLQGRASTTFSSILENITTIKRECAEMSGIVLSEDSTLGSRWDNVATNMSSPIDTIDDTFLIVKTLLDTYVSDTIANEQAAQKELEAIDEGIGSLGQLASSLFDGLSALLGIGFGATAIAIPGLRIGDPGTGSGGTVVTKYAPPTVEPEIPVEKYAPPTVVTKYAPPSIEPIEPVEKYAPPTVVTKYAPPEVTTKYAPPTVVTKYAPPSVEIEPVMKYAPPTVVTKYAPPEVTIKYAPPGYIEPEVPIMKYAPPEYMNSTINKGE